jgi:hypothetical protein
VWCVVHAVWGLCGVMVCRVVSWFAVLGLVLTGCVWSCGSGTGGRQLHKFSKVSLKLLDLINVVEEGLQGGVVDK